MSDTKVGLLRSVGKVEEKLLQKAMWYSREMLLDTGQSYTFWDTNKDKLVNLETLIGAEITYSVNEKGRIILHGLPEPPKIKVPAAKPTPRAVEGINRERYWENKDEWDKTVSGIIERQFFITFAKDLAIPMGRLSDANWKEVGEEAVKFGIELYLKYGKTEV